MARGCANFRTSTLVRHARSSDHKRAIEEIKRKRDFKNTSKKALSKKDNALIKCLRMVYWLAKEKLPISKYPSLYEMTKEQDVNLEPLNVQGLLLRNF